MKQFWIAASLCLAGCQAYAPPPLGASEQQVVAQLGQPTHRYADGDGHLLEYMKGPAGQSTYMARIGPGGQLLSYEQVLNLETFGKIRVGQDTKADVQRLIGAPSEIKYYRLKQREGWNYPYREQNTWDSMMTVLFDDAGVVRGLENGPDPYRMPSDSRL